MSQIGHNLPLANVRYRAATDQNHPLACDYFSEKCTQSAHHQTVQCEIKRCRNAALNTAGTIDGKESTKVGCW